MFFLKKPKKNRWVVFFRFFEKTRVFLNPAEKVTKLNQSANF